MFENPTFWYIIGRYVGDGWRRYDKLHKGIIIACSRRNKDKLTDAIESVGWNYTLCKESPIYKVIVYSKELSEFVERYGYKAAGKRIDGETLSLPVNLLSGFLDGYIDSDGHFNEKDGHYNISTVSRELAAGFCQCVAKVFHSPCKVNLCKRPRKTVIENRTVNQRDFYIVRFKKDVRKQDKAFYEDGMIWFPINQISFKEESIFVYNIEVDSDNSYTANGAIVHNCQSVSSAGLQHGFTEGSGTRSSIIWNVRDAVKIKRPKYLALENVKNMVSKKFVGLFNLWQEELTRFGYTNFAEILNSKDYGIPQHRARIFLVSILGDAWYQFPQPIPLQKKLMDLLEEDVDEKYYISQEKVDKFLKNLSPKQLKKGNYIPVDYEI